MTCEKHKETRNQMINDIADECKGIIKDGELSEKDSQRLIVLAATAAKMSSKTVGDGIASAVQFVRSNLSNYKTGFELAAAFERFTKSDGDFRAMMDVNEIMMNVLVVIANSVAVDVFVKGGMPKALAKELVKATMPERKTSLKDLGDTDIKRGNN